MGHPAESNVLNQGRKTAALAGVQTNHQTVAGTGKTWTEREET